MSNNPADDARSIWQSQLTEGTIVSVEELQKNAARLKAKMRRGGAIWVAAGITQIVASVARQYLEQSVLGPWIAVVDYISLVVVVLYWPYQYTLMAEWPISLALAAGSTPSLDFYRRRLDLQRDFFRYDYGGLPKLAVAVFALILFALKHPMVMIPIGGVVLIWGVASYLRMKRDSAAIHREMDELDAFRRTQV